MDLSTFYALMSATCFTLVGLWWTVVERRPGWRDDAARRRLAGGVYLSFLLPGLMSLLAQVSPDNPLVWRTSFVAAAVVGLWSTWGLLRVEQSLAVLGPFRRNRWAVGAIYLLVIVLGGFPELARTLGAAPLQVGGFLLVLLVVLAHGLTWEFLMEPDPTPESDPTA